MEINPGSHYFSGPFCWFLSVFFIRPLKNRLKTAQILLENRSKITARNERFLSGFLSKIWAVWAVFPKKNAQTAQTAQTAQILLKNRSNRSYLEQFLSGISTRVSNLIKILLRGMRMLSDLRILCCWFFLYHLYAIWHNLFYDVCIGISWRYFTNATMRCFTFIFAFCS